MIPQPTQTTGWQPPAKYEQVPSTLEGISVWQPRKEEAKVEAPATYTCPNCGASTRYDTAAGGVACGYVQLFED